MVKGSIPWQRATPKREVRKCADLTLQVPWAVCLLIKEKIPHFEEQGKRLLHLGITERGLPASSRGRRWPQEGQMAVGTDGGWDTVMEAELP